MDELQVQLKQVQGERAELASRNRLLASACEMMLKKKVYIYMNIYIRGKDVGFSLNIEQV